MPRARTHTHTDHTNVQSEVKFYNYSVMVSLDGFNYMSRLCPRGKFLAAPTEIESPQLVRMSRFQSYSVTVGIRLETFTGSKNRKSRACCMVTLFTTMADSRQRAKHQNKPSQEAHSLRRSLPKYHNSQQQRQACAVNICKLSTAPP